MTAIPDFSDHPRACGVYKFLMHMRSLGGGSSPRVRGLQNPLAEFKRGLRIIPARAGFTVTPEGVAYATTDHPRACGVYTPRPVRSRGLLGSSPRVRGLPVDRAKIRE